MSLDPVAERGLVLLGCGKMGLALLEGWLAHGLPVASISVIEPVPSPRLLSLAADGLRLNSATPDLPCVAVVAVKPQMMGAALPRIAALGDGRTLFVSIAAGTPLQALQAAIGPRAPIVRAMPNTPAAIGCGVTALVANSLVKADEYALAEALMGAVGATVRLEEEAHMDAVTAVSGSGPAYVFLLIEALAEAGEAQGLPPDLAMRLARATVDGAGRLAAVADEAPGQLRRDVTSPGGTTAAALEVLMDANGGLPDLLARAVAAATARSRTLGD